MANKINKKYLLWGGVLLAIIVAMVIASLILSRAENGEERAKYTLDLEYEENSHTLLGEEVVEYFNSSENMFTTLSFHLYPNAFREGSKTPVVSSNNFSEAYPNGDSYGNIEIAKVTFVDGSPATYDICGEDENILSVTLKEELYPQESVALNISFKTTLANTNHRLGYGENTINLGNFYPIACVYEDGVGFSQNAYHSNGDPFYSQCADYDVTLRYHQKFSLASSGKQMEVSNEGEMVAVKIEGRNIRDFCCVLSERFEKATSTVGKVEVNYFGYAGDGNLQECLQTGIDAMTTFQELYGEYPYSQISIVKSNFVHGGMEYPNIVLISDTIEGQADINYVIVHELAHQWWYGLVGNDQYNHAWIDEGLAEFSTLLFFKHNESYGEDYEELVDGATESYKLFEKIYTKVTGSVDGRMERGLRDFSTEPEYVQCVYTKGVLMFDALRELVGEKKLLSTLRGICGDYKYKTISSAEFVAEFVSSCGRSMEGFFESWLSAKVIIA